MTEPESTTTPAPEPTKVCTACGEARPLSAYRLRRKGKSQRQTYCGDCRNEKIRQQTRKQQAHDLKRGINLARRQRTDPRVVELVVQMIQRFGGVEKMAEVWWRELNVAFDERPGNYWTLNSFEVLFKLLTECSKDQDQGHADQSAVLVQMSDDQLQAATRAALAELFGEGFGADNAGPVDEAAAEEKLAMIANANGDAEARDCA